MKASVAQLVPGRGPKSAGWVDVAWEIKRRDNRRPLRAVTDRVRLPVNLLGREGGLRHPEGAKHEGFDRGPVSQTCGDFDQSAEKDESGVVIADERAERG